MNIFSIVRPLLYSVSPEFAHELAMIGIKYGIVSLQKPIKHASLNRSLFGLEFQNPVGMAAGFDKDARIYQKLFNQGFGFVEVGTITPKAQIGNSKPRLFRLSDDEAIINRMGFNNRGVENAKNNLLSRNLLIPNIIGINIGKNKNTENAIDDYKIMMEEMYYLADYITINISSPNTQGLRDLQNKSVMYDLMKSIFLLRDKLANNDKRNKYNKKSVLVKIAPDLTSDERKDIAEVALDIGIDGLIVSNTTISRPNNLKDSQKNEQGGLSGKPLMELSTEVLADMYRFTKGKIPLIGVGGVSSAEDAICKIRNGASLIQLYSALVFQGFGLINEINSGIIEHLKSEKLNNISELVGVDVSMS